MKVLFISMVAISTMAAAILTFPKETGKHTALINRNIVLNTSIIVMSFLMLTLTLTKIALPLVAILGIVNIGLLSVKVSYNDDYVNLNGLLADVNYTANCFLLALSIFSTLAAFSRLRDADVLLTGDKLTQLEKLMEHRIDEEKAYRLVRTFSEKRMTNLIRLLEELGIMSQPMGVDIITFSDEKNQKWIDQILKSTVPALQARRLWSRNAKKQVDLSRGTGVLPPSERESLSQEEDIPEEYIPQSYPTETYESLLKRSLTKLLTERYKVDESIARENIEYVANNRDDSKTWFVQVMEQLEKVENNKNDKKE